MQVGQRMDMSYGWDGSAMNSELDCSPNYTIIHTKQDLITLLDAYIFIYTLFYKLCNKLKTIIFYFVMLNLTHHILK